MVDFYGFHVGKYTIHGSYGLNFRGVCHKNHRVFKDTYWIVRGLLLSGMNATARGGAKQMTLDMIDSRHMIKE